MKYCTHCGGELLDEAVMCPKCGCAVGRSVNAAEVRHSDSRNVLCIIGFALSFFSSIVGLILSIIGRKQVTQSGEKGKDLATAGIVISSVRLALIVVYFILIFTLIIIGIMQAPYSEF